MDRMFCWLSRLIKTSINLEKLLQIYTMLYYAVLFFISFFTSEEENNVPNLYMSHVLPENNES